MGYKFNRMVFAISSIILILALSTVIFSGDILARLWAIFAIIIVVISFIAYWSENH